MISTWVGRIAVAIATSIVQVTGAIIGIGLYRWGKGEDWEFWKE